MTENVGHAPLSMFGANMDQISCLLHYMRTLLPTGLVIWGAFHCVKHCRHRMSLAMTLISCCRLVAMSSGKWICEFSRRYKHPERNAKRPVHNKPGCSQHGPTRRLPCRRILPRSVFAKIRAGSERLHGRDAKQRALRNSTILSRGHVSTCSLLLQRSGMISAW